MPRGAPTHTSSDPLLLGLLGLGAAGLVVLSVLARGSRPAILVSSTPAPVEGARVATALPMSGEREPVPAHERSATAGEPEVVSASTQAGGKAPRKEREFLQDFLALERARPGALAERAGELLAGGGPSAKKVALLRALGESGSKEHLRWLEHAVRDADEYLRRRVAVRQTDFEDPDSRGLFFWPAFVPQWIELFEI